MTAPRFALALALTPALIASLPGQFVPRLPRLTPTQQQSGAQAQAPAQQPAPTELPAWMQAGTRVTYYTGSATLHGVRTQLVPGDDGSWVDSQGRRYREQDLPNSAGAGYTQYEFAQVAADRIAVNQTLYIFADTGMRNVTRAGSEAFFGDRNGLSDVWLPPTKLRALLEQGALGVRRAPCQLDGRTFDAVVTEVRGSSGYTRYTYDLDSGLMLSFSSSSTGASVVTTNGDTASRGAGATTIATAQLRSVRQLQLPWTGQRAPQWLQQGQQLTWTGSYRNSITEGTLAPWRIDGRQTIRQAVDGGGTALFETWLDYGNGQGQQGRSQRAFGPGAFANFYLDPSSVGGLSAGQVLDRDPVTGWQIVFAGSDGRTATIQEVGTHDQQSYVYSLENGMLLRTTQQQRQGPAVITIDLQLVQQ